MMASGPREGLYTKVPEKGANIEQAKKYRS
jgi:hypothetical protein